MQNFFDPTEHSEILIPMYGSIHIITLFSMLAIVFFMIWKKDHVQKIVANRKFLVRALVVYLLLELSYWIIIWSFSVEPKYERFPLHLCATLSLLMPLLILTRKYSLFRFLSFWSVCAGFISLVNPSFIHDSPWSFAFMHYIVRHYFLFLFPVLMHLGMNFKYNYREFLFSCATLTVYAFIIFLLNWATGANYMHLGKNNPLEIPFLPSGFTIWPWSYPSFVAIGFILLNIVYLSFSKTTIKIKV